MSGKSINSEQVKLYMKSRKTGKSQAISAAKSGISERSGRRIEKGTIQSGNPQNRSWRTRIDPFEMVWESEVVPMLTKDLRFTPITLFEWLQKQHPGEYPDSKLRTFQRRVREWKALYGPDQEVMFRQEHVPGRMGLSDFTQLKKVNITVKEKPFKHLLYHFRLAFSGWCSIKVVLGGESYSAFAEGLQHALRLLGGSPREHRSDSLSAAYRNLDKKAAEDVTARYKQFCQNYNMEPTRNNRGEGHENGSIESPHGHLKKRIRQALLLRGSNDFESVPKYEEFLDQVVQDINLCKRDKIEEEIPYLQPLPLYHTADYTELVVKVSTSSTIQVKLSLYTVPSRLIGVTLRVHVYDTRLEIYLGSTHTVTLPRVYPSKANHRARSVDYRHVIESLERKPQAFRYSKLREDLLPDETYKEIWNWLDTKMESRKACKAIVGILALAHRGNCEKQLGEHLQLMMDRSDLPSLHLLQQQFETKKQTVPSIEVNQPQATVYDALLESYSQGVN